MGKTRATYEAIRDRIEAVHGPAGTHATKFPVVKLTLRTPFEAVEAGDLDRYGIGCVVGVTASTPISRSGAGRRVLSSVAVSVFLVGMLPGRGTEDGQDEETLLGRLLDATDDVVGTLETINKAPATTLAGLAVDDITILYDESGNYAAVEIRLTTSVVRI